MNLDLKIDTTSATTIRTLADQTTKSGGRAEFILQSLTTNEKFEVKNAPFHQSKCRKCQRDQWLNTHLFYVFITSSQMLLTGKRRGCRYFVSRAFVYFYS